MTVVKRVSLPAECFRPADIDVVSRGDSNEDLARAYRDNLDETAAVNTQLEECYALNGTEVTEQ